VKTGAQIIVKWDQHDTIFFRLTPAQETIGLKGTSGHLPAQVAAFPLPYLSLL